MQPLDQAARREIAAAAKRVSLVTALSPRAVLDVLFVAAQAVRLVRRIAEIYGGRPGFLGFIRLARSVGTHLAITGGVAVGDSLVQQVVGHGIAARLSARLGEGVLNGMLTARVGLSAMAVCRPMPFAAEKPPSVSDVAPFLFSKDRAQQDPRRRRLNFRPEATLCEFGATISQSVTVMTSPRRSGLKRMMTTIATATIPATSERAKL